MSKSLCFIHLKASDCPGWALWEAFATATPIVLTEILIKRMKFEDLYIDGETCLTWGKTSYEQDKDDPKIIREFMDDSKDEMIREIEEAVEKLKNPEYNRKIGLAGHLKWKKLTEWTPLKQYQLKEYFKKHGIKTT